MKTRNVEEVADFAGTSGKLPRARLCGGVCQYEAPAWGEINSSQGSH